MAEFDEKLDQEEVLRLTVDVVAAYASANQIETSELVEVVKSVHGTLIDLANGSSAPDEPAPEPAVPINKSITPDYLICLEDGKKLKMLKRYLRTHFDMTPEEYRQKWGLPSDYPMVAPNYAKRRSEFAKQIGLGRTATRGRQ